MAASIMINSTFTAQPSFLCFVFIIVTILIIFNAIITTVIIIKRETKAMTQVAAQFGRHAAAVACLVRSEARAAQGLRFSSSRAI